MKTASHAALCRLLAVLCLVFALCLAWPARASANSAGLPELTVLVPHAPKDMTVTLLDPDQQPVKELYGPERRGWEAYYRLTYAEQPPAGCWLRLQSGGSAVVCALPPEAFAEYNSLVTVQQGGAGATPRLTVGQPLTRRLLLCALRLLLTLGIEGTVFWLHGYRSKQSWRVFLLLNLATQLFVNVVFAGPYLNTYAATLALFGYLLVEAIVFGVEIAVCGKYMPEHGPQQARDCAALANFVSAVAGALVLAWLPV